MNDNQLQEYQEKFKRIEELVGKLETTADPAARAVAKELVQSLMDVHGLGLERMLDIVSQAEGGTAIVDQLGNDELARNLLLLYGLHPVDVEERVAEALDKVRPYLRSRDADVELVNVEPGGVRVRLTGNAHGCTASTLKSAIEEALYRAAPDLGSVTVETEDSGSVFVPLADLRMLNVTGD
jgi:Fe-S cluster biogenesis protein NfuA